MFETVTRTCSNCHRPFEGLALVVAQTVCPICVEREEARDLEMWQTAERAALPQTLTARLAACGLGAAELAAERERVPVEIKRLLPKRDVLALLSGAALEDITAFQSFGLAGGQGIGKTMCLASILKARTEVLLREAIAAALAAPDPAQPAAWSGRAGFIWTNWPEYAAWAKATIMQPHGSDLIDGATRRMLSTSLLVLDDLGRERLAKGGYDEDYAVGLLDRVIDARSRNRRATLWTSNLAPAALATRYGAALVSRLLGLAPAVELPRLADLRLAVDG